MEVNKHLKKISENVKMKCILSKNNKKFREWGFFELMADPGLIIAFVHGLLAACSPAQG